MAVLIKRSRTKQTIVDDEFEVQLFKQIKPDKIVEIRALNISIEMSFEEFERLISYYNETKF